MFPHEVFLTPQQINECVAQLREAKPSVQIEDNPHDWSPGREWVWGHRTNGDFGEWMPAKDYARVHCFAWELMELLPMSFCLYRVEQGPHTGWWVCDDARGTLDGYSAIDRSAPLAMCLAYIAHFGHSQVTVIEDEEVRKLTLDVLSGTSCACGAYSYGDECFGHVSNGHTPNRQEPREQRSAICV